MIHLNPSWIPSTSTPSRAQRIVAAPITALIPGAGPPPTAIATFRRPLMVCRTRVEAVSRRPGRLWARPDGEPEHHHAERQQHQAPPQIHVDPERAGIDLRVGQK